MGRGSAVRATAPNAPGSSERKYLREVVSGEFLCMGGLGFKPPGFRKGGRYPAMVMIHGGPQGMTGDSFHPRWNLQMFAAKGYDATTVDEVAGAADVSRRTLFRYFPSKESLVFHDTEERLGRFRAALDEAVAEGETAFGATRRGLIVLAADYMADREGFVVRQQIV